LKPSSVFRRPCADQGQSRVRWFYGGQVRLLDIAPERITDLHVNLPLRRRPPGMRTSAWSPTTIELDERGWRGATPSWVGCEDRGSPLRCALSARSRGRGDGLSRRVGRGGPFLWRRTVSSAFFCNQRRRARDHRGQRRTVTISWDGLRTGPTIKAIPIWKNARSATAASTAPSKTANRSSISGFTWPRILPVSRFPEGLAGAAGNDLVSRFMIRQGYSLLCPLSAGPVRGPVAGWYPPLDHRGGNRRGVLGRSHLHFRLESGPQSDGPLRWEEDTSVRPRCNAPSSSVCAACSMPKAKDPVIVATAAACCKPPNWFCRCAL